MWQFGRKNIKQFKKSEEAFGNPLMGYAPGAWNLEISQDISLLYMDITWAKLEPEGKPAGKMAKRGQASGAALCL